MSSTRVMATCSILGQAMGTAAAIAAQYGLTPAGVYEEKIQELKETLMDDDCYLPWNRRKIPELSKTAKLAASENDPEPLRNGIDRPVGDEMNCWSGKIGSWVQYEFMNVQQVNEVRFVFDSDLNRTTNKLPRCYPLEGCAYTVPESIVRAFRIEALDESGNWNTVARVDNNYQRLVRVKVNAKTRGIKFVPESTWGSDKVCVFAFDVR